MGNDKPMTEAEIEAARRASREPETDRVAQILMDAWQKAEGKPVNVSYIATFCDMARAVIVNSQRLDHENTVLVEQLFGAAERLEDGAGLRAQVEARDRAIDALTDRVASLLRRLAIVSAAADLLAEQSGGDGWADVVERLTVERDAARAEAARLVDRRSDEVRP